MTNSVHTLFGTFDEKQLKSLRGYIDEIVLCMNRTKSNNESIGDILDLANDELNLPKKIIRKIANYEFKQSLSSDVAEFKEVEALIEGIKDAK
jgi:hypothetical protein